MNLSRPDSIKKLILFSTRHHRHSHLSQSRQMRNSQLSHASIFGRFPWAHTHISGSGRHRICIAECESLCWECENGKNQPRNGKINYEMDKSLERQRRRRSSILVPHTRSLRGDNKIVEVWMGNRMRDSTTLLPPKRCHGFSILDKWFVGFSVVRLLHAMSAFYCKCRQRWQQEQQLTVWAWMWRRFVTRREPKQKYRNTRDSTTAKMEGISFLKCQFVFGD